MDYRKMAKMSNESNGRVYKRLEMIREDIKILSEAWESIIERLAWERGEEGALPPVEDLRMSVRLCHNIARDMAAIEKMITDNARAAGLPFTPSPGMPCPETLCIPEGSEGLWRVLEVLTSQRTSLEDHADAITMLRNAISIVNKKGAGAMKSAHAADARWNSPHAYVTVEYDEAAVQEFDTRGQNYSMADDTWGKRVVAREVETNETALLILECHSYGDGETTTNNNYVVDLALDQ